MYSKQSLPLPPSAGAPRGGLYARRTAPSPCRTIPVDFIERDTEYVLRADIPGVHKASRQAGRGITKQTRACMPPNCSSCEAERDPGDCGRQHRALWPPAAPRPRGARRERTGVGRCSRGRDCDVTVLLWGWVLTCRPPPPPPGHLPPGGARQLLPRQGAAHARQCRLRANWRQGEVQAVERLGWPSVTCSQLVFGTCNAQKVCPAHA
jgi:hypothetical protein